MKTALLSALLLASAVMVFAQDADRQGPRRGPRKEMSAEDQAKAKAFQENVKKYNETKDEKALAQIKETLAGRYDTEIANMKARIEKMEKQTNKDEKTTQMLDRTKKRLEELTKGGKEAFVEKQVQQLGKKNAPRGGGKKERGGKPASKE